MGGEEKEKAACGSLQALSRHRDLVISERWLIQDLNGPACVWCAQKVMNFWCGRVLLHKLSQGLIQEYRHGFACFSADPVQMPDPTAVYTRLVQLFVIVPFHPLRCHLRLF